MREDRPQDPIQYGVDFGGNFVGVLKRHMATKQKYLNREPGRGLLYGGIENLRPETNALVKSMAAWMKQPKGK
jgi:arylsulfatase